MHGACILDIILQPLLIYCQLYSAPEFKASCPAQLKMTMARQGYEDNKDSRKVTRNESQLEMHKMSIVTMQLKPSIV